ncbi:alpha/beta fold hydrolase [Polynucleobacter necessarius]|uniref:alpha/beta fold hydrolase n=1 Tax=Polynucleobacter necessarius TaxID=576610 RepID=UPI0039E5BE12
MDTLNRPSEIVCPTLILVGECDHGTPPQMSRAMKEKMTNAQLHEIPNAGHISNIEQPEVFHRYLLNFYRQNNFL